MFVNRNIERRAFIKFLILQSEWKKKSYFLLILKNLILSIVCFAHRKFKYNLGRKLRKTINTQIKLFIKLQILSKLSLDIE